MRRNDGRSRSTRSANTPSRDVQSFQPSWSGHRTDACVRRAGQSLQRPQIRYQVAAFLGGQLAGAGDFGGAVQVG